MICFPVFDLCIREKKMSQENERKNIFIYLTEKFMLSDTKC